MWVLTGLVFGVLLLVAQHTYGPLDDPNPAYQRPGFLDLQPSSAAPRVTPDVPNSQAPSVVLFIRPQLASALADQLGRASGLRATASIVVVSSGAAPVDLPVPAVVDERGALARGFAMRVPRDGGPPVGYAVIDAHGAIRYRSLDPSITTSHGFDEIQTIVDAAR